MWNDDTSLSAGMTDGETDPTTVRAAETEPGRLPCVDQKLRLFKAVLGVLSGDRSAREMASDGRFTLEELYEAMAGFLSGAFFADPDIPADMKRDISDQVADTQTYCNSLMLTCLTSTMTEGVVICDPNGRIWSWNHAAVSMLGYQQADILGKILYETLIPETRKLNVRDAFIDFRETGVMALEGLYLPVMAKHHDGHLLPMHLTTKSVRRGNRQWIVGIFRDRSVDEEEVSSLKKALVAQKLVAQSHRDKLSELLADLQYLRKSMDNSDDMDGLAKQLDHILEDIPLKEDAIYSDLQKESGVHLHFADILPNLQQLYRAAFSNKSIQFDCYYDQQLRIDFDVMLFRRILKNILSEIEERAETGAKLMISILSDATEIGLLPRELAGSGVVMRLSVTRCVLEGGCENIRIAKRLMETERGGFYLKNHIQVGASILIRFP